MVTDVCIFGQWTLLENDDHWNIWAGVHKDDWATARPVVYPVLAFESEEGGRPWPAYLDKADVFEMAIAHKLFQTIKA